MNVVLSGLCIQSVSKFEGRAKLSEWITKLSALSKSRLFTAFLLIIALALTLPVVTYLGDMPILELVKASRALASIYWHSERAFNLKLP